MALQTNDAVATKVGQLLDALIDFDKPLPSSAVEWDDLEKLESICATVDRAEVAASSSDK